MKLTCDSCDYFEPLSEGLGYCQLFNKNTGENGGNRCTAHTKMEGKDVTVVDHGNPFGSGQWYTFYCPDCNSQVSGRQEVCKCGLRMKWKEVKNQ